VKWEPQADGSVTVYGKATGPELDLDDQIIDADFARKGMKAWFDSAANVRQMHSPLLLPAGKALTLEEEPDGQYITAKISEPGAAKLVNDGVYQAFSVGIAAPVIQRDRAARKGRIVGGEVVEVSLVDRPSNPTTKILDVRKFLMVKMAPDGPEWLDRAVITKADGSTEDDKAELPISDSGTHGAFDGTHTHDHQDGAGDSHSHEHTHDGDGNHGHSHTAAQAPDDGVDDADKAAMARTLGLPVPATVKRDFTEADRKELAASGHAKSDGSYPIVTSSDVTAAVNDFNRSNGTPSDKAHIISRAEAIGAADNLPDDWKDDGKDDADSATKAHSRVPGYAAKRLHDALCVVYDWDKVATTYPALAKDGVAGALGPATTSMIYQMLTQEVSEDAGSGSEALDIKELAAAYHELTDFLAGEAMEDAMAAPSLMMDARAKLRKWFIDANLEAGIIKAGDATPRGDAAGMQTILGSRIANGGESDAVPAVYPPTDPPANAIPDFIIASGGKPIPTPSDPPQPGSFIHPYLAAGHARESASGSPPRPPGAHTVSPSIAQATTIPGEERSSPANKTDGRVVGSGSAVYAAAAQQQAANALQEIHDHWAQVFPGLCAMAMDHGSPAVINMDGALKEGASPSLLTTKSAPEASDIRKLVDAAVNDFKADYEAKIADLQETVNKMASEPDSSQAPARSAAGMAALASGDDKTGAANPALRKSHANEAQEQLATQERAEKRELLGSIARAGATIQERIAAQTALDALGSD
jgi:hypothetical protein